MIRRLKHFLDDHQVQYTAFTHSPAFTAQEIAANAHVSGKDLAKPVIVKLDGQLAMVVTAANQRCNLMRLKELSGAKEVELAHEYEFKTHFPDCEVGAMPPFAELCDTQMDVYVDESLIHEKDIWFNAGNHSELIKMSYEDWAKLVKPRVVCLH